MKMGEGGKKKKGVPVRRGEEQRSPSVRLNARGG